MADNNISSNIKLDATTVQKLKEMETTVARARKDIQTLKKLGMETRDLEDKLNWAEEARKTLLTEFT